jgi:hypothetical protein
MEVTVVFVAGSADGSSARACFHSINRSQVDAAEGCRMVAETGRPLISLRPDPPALLVYGKVILMEVDAAGEKNRKPVRRQGQPSSPHPAN